MRVYKFLTCKYGLKAIRDRRLKISELDTLNDLFDLLPVDLSDPEIRKGAVAARNEIGKRYGLLCFSKHWHNPVLWSHYAENHQGICLGFDVPDKAPMTVEYVEEPFKLTHLDLEIVEKMLIRKYKDWSYEEEVRMWTKLEKNFGGYYFADFEEELRLVEVILGAGCHVSQRRLLQALGAHQSGVRLLKARLAFDAFRVVEDENGFGSGEVYGYSEEERHPT